MGPLPARVMQYPLEIVFFEGRVILFVFENVAENPFSSLATNLICHSIVSNAKTL